MNSDLQARAQRVWQIVIEHNRPAREAAVEVGVSANRVGQIVAAEAKRRYGLNGSTRKGGMIKIARYLHTERA